jgi:hypothetical protein
MTAAEALRVRDLAGEIAATRRDGVKALLREANLPQPGFVWDPSGDLLPVPVLALLRKAWDAMRGTNDVPSVALLESLELGDAALDCAFADAEFRYRKIGTRLTQSGGVDPASTGETLALLLRAVLAAAALRRKPIFMLHAAPARGGRCDSWARLTLPLVAEIGAPVTGFLVGAMPMVATPVSLGAVSMPFGRLH